MSLSATATALVAPPTFPALAAGLFGLETPDDPYEVVIVNKVGTPRVAPLELAFPGDIVETINAPDEFTIGFPKSAYTTEDIAVLGDVAGGGDEVQIRLGDKVLAWGPAVGVPNGGSGQGDVQIDCRGVDWYFPKRAIDEEPEQLLPGGSFEDDFTEWLTSGSTSPGVPGGGTIGDGITPEIQTDLVLDGTKAARFTSFLAPTGLAATSVPNYFTAGPFGNVLALTFSFVLETFVEPNAFKAGVLFLASPPGPDLLLVGGVNAVGAALYSIDENTPVGTEVRAQLLVRIPPNQTWVFEVWLFAPGTGIITFDKIRVTPRRQLTTQAFTGSPTATVDVSRIVQMLADHALTDRHNKSDLHIAIDAPVCGVRQARVYDFVDHLFFDQALNEFLDRNDCFEYRIVYTQTTRTLTLYPITDGGMGTDRSADVTLTLGAPPFATYTVSIDGGSVVTQATVLGDGSGLTREEGWATDADAIGGTILQGVTNATAGAPDNTLLPTANAQLDALKQPAAVIEITITREPGGFTGDDTVVLADLLELGDRVTLDIPDGWHTYTGVWRIVRRTRHTRERPITLTLNPVLA